MKSESSHLTLRPGSASAHFIIVAFGRSGSTFLVELLRSHPSIVCYHEPFNQAKPHWPLNCEQDTLRLAQAIFHHGIEGGPRDLGRPELHYGEKPAVGFKVTVSQLLKDAPGLARWFESRPALRVILLDRKSVFRRFLSYRLALARGRWHGTRKAHVVTQRISLDPRAFDRFLERRAREGTALQELLAKTTFPVLPMDYETLIARRNESVNQAVRFLGLPARPTYQATSVKLARGSLQSLVENYDEMERLFPKEVAAASQ